MLTSGEDLAPLVAEAAEVEEGLLGLLGFHLNQDARLEGIDEGVDEGEDVGTEKSAM